MANGTVLFAAPPLCDKCFHNVVLEILGKEQHLVVDLVTQGGLCEHCAVKHIYVKRGNRLQYKNAIKYGEMD